MTKVLPPSGAPPREVATAINQLIQGKINSIGSVTLAASPATQTVVSAPNGTLESVIALSPATASAAAALTGVWVVPAMESFTINHPVSAAIDRTFRYAILG